jgi:hypothetical protein
VLVYLAALTRLVGVFVGPVLAASRVIRTRRLDRVALGYVSSSAAGLLTVGLAQWRAVGDAFAFLHSEEAWGRSLSWPWVPIADGIGDVVEQLPGIAAEAVLNTGCIVTLLVVAGHQLGRELRRREVGTEPLGLWGAAASVVPLLSRLVGSMARYSVTAWSAIALLAALLLRMPRAVRYGFWGLSSAASFLLARRLNQGIFVG